MELIESNEGDVIPATPHPAETAAALQAEGLARSAAAGGWQTGVQIVKGAPKGAPADASSGGWKTSVTIVKGKKKPAAADSAPAPSTRRDLSTLSSEELDAECEASAQEIIETELALLVAQASSLESRSRVANGVLAAQLRTSPEVDAAEARHKRAKARAIETRIAWESAKRREWEARAAERRKPRAERAVTSSETLASEGTIGPGESVRLDHVLARDAAILWGAVSPEVAIGFAVEESSIGLRLLGGPALEVLCGPCCELFGLQLADGSRADPFDEREWPCANIFARAGQVLSLKVRNVTDAPLAFALVIAFGDVPPEEPYELRRAR